MPSTRAVLPRAAGRAFGLALAFALASCQTTADRPALVGSAPAIEVKVPVAQPCIDPSQIEPLPDSAMPARTAGPEALASGAAADALRYREIARRQYEMLKACSNVQGSKP